MTFNLLGGHYVLSSSGTTSGCDCILVDHHFSRVCPVASCYRWGMDSGDLLLLRCRFLLDDLFAFYRDSLSEYGSQLLLRCLSGFDLLPGKGRYG